MDQTRLEHLLAKFSGITLAVIGDYFLDHYLMLNRSLSEISIETGLEAYQVVDSRTYPGAAGTVVSNLRALDVNVLALGLSGDDGSGYELRMKLTQNGVDLRGLIEVPGYATPTYIKPMMAEPDGRLHELNRLDVKRRRPLPSDLEDKLIEQMGSLLPEADGMLVIDQVTERNCGVVTDRLRAEIERQALAHPDKLIQVDSRAFLGLFDHVTLKSNLEEVARAIGDCTVPDEPVFARAERCGRQLSRCTRRPVIITLSSQGMCIIPAEDRPALAIPAVPVRGPIDIVGAGDSVNAATGAAQCAGATLAEAGQIGALVASIVIQQIGVTGTASPAQVLARNISGGERL